MSVDARSGHAIVLGASIGGLLAARALSDSFEQVTVFDRDDLPAGATNRRGVPQGEHLHGLLARGRQILEEFFPGFTADLTAQGAVPVDVQRDCIWRNDGRAIPRAESGMRGICLSRPALEAYVRDRVRAIAHVEIHAGHEALGLLTDATGNAVSGARLLPRNDAGLPSGHEARLAPGHDGGEQDGSDQGGSDQGGGDQGGGEQRHDADLVVDATGRGNRGPTWLADIGYERPPEERVDPQTVYVSRDYRRVPGDADFAASVTSPSPANPHGGIAIATEGDRWMVTLFSAGGAPPPPTDPDGYLEFTTRLPGRELRALLHRAEPLGPPRPIRLPTSVRRRYEHLRRLPEGFIALGDSVCTFNPAYAQGMTVAAAQAKVLRDLALHTERRNGLTRRYFAGAAKVNDVAWDIAVGADLRYPAVVGPRSRKTRFLNAYVGRLHVAAERHPVVGRRFLSVANLMTSPAGLFAPGILSRVLWSGR